MPCLRQKTYALISEALEDVLPRAGRAPTLKDKIVLVDVGASKGIQAKGIRQRHNIVPGLV